MNNFLKSRRLYMLFVLPFLVAATALVGTYFPVVSTGTLQTEGCIGMAFIHRMDQLWLSVSGGVAVLLIAYAIFLINEQFRLLQQTTTLPSLLYVLLASGAMMNLGLNALLVAVFILTLAVGRLQVAINDIKGNQSLFDFGALVSLAVAVYPKFALLLLWALCATLFSGRSTLKDISALFLGLMTPVVFLVFYYFWTDSPVQLPEIFVSSLLSGEYTRHLSAVEFIRLGLLFFLLLVALGGFSVHYSALAVSHRRSMLAFISMLFFLSVTLFAFPVDYYDFIYALAFPLAFIYTLFFLVHRVALFGNLMFLLFLCACFLPCFW